jgi:ATP-dependent helicase IRC3
MLKLHDYQMLCVSYTTAAIASGNSSVYFSLSTGTGKSVILASLAAERLTLGRALVIVPRANLVAQMMRTFASFGLTVGGNETNAHVIVATWQSLRQRTLTRLISDGAFATVFIDEAHHAVPGSKIADALHYLREANPNIAAIGCTATPFRADRKKMTDVLPVCAFNRDIDEMQAGGWLAPTLWQRVAIGWNLNAIRTKKGDYDERALGVSATAPRTVAEIVVKTAPLLASRKRALVFACNIAHAKALALGYAQAGFKAISVDGTMSRTEQARILREFASGELSVVVNAQLLTEGFDLPTIDALVFARPTRSVPLYVQMLGRGLRTAPGKKDCLILDVAGNTNASDPAQILLRDIIPDAKPNPGWAPEPSAAVRTHRLRPGTPEADPAHAWVIVPTPTGTAYFLPLEDHETGVIFRNTGGNGLSTALRLDRNFREVGTILDGATLPPAIAAVKGLANHTLASSGTPWRSDPPSDKQRAYAAQCGIPIPEGATKGEASHAILEAKARRYVAKLTPVVAYG